MHDHIIRLLDELDDFSLKVNSYYDDAGYESLIDSLLSGKITALAMSLSRLGMLNEAQELHGLTLDRGGALPVLEILRGSIIPNVRDTLRNIAESAVVERNVHLFAPSATAPVDVFIAYSRHDEQLKDELLKHLAIIRRQGIVREWHDRRVIPGQDWDTEIRARLNRARIILLLVSADFLASEYCFDMELVRAFERHRRGEAVVVPLILRPCDWTHTSLAQLQALPKDAHPVVSWSSRDDAWHNVNLGLRAVVASMRATPVRNASQSATAAEEQLRRPHTVGRDDSLLAHSSPDVSHSTITVESGFVTLEPYSFGVFTAVMDAFGYKELQLSLAIGSQPPRFESRFIVKPARAGGFTESTYGSFVPMAIRVGSPEPYGIVRAEVPIPLGSALMEVEIALIPEHGWHLEETKQFYATCGPPSNPTGYRSAPLTVKKVR